MNETPNGFEGTRTVPPVQQNNILGKLSMIFGIIGLVASSSFGIAAVILAFVSKKKLGYADGMTKAGMIMGWIEIATALFLAVAVIAAIVAFPELGTKIADAVRGQ